MGKKKCTALWDELLKGEDNTTKEANCSPRLTPSIQNNSTDSNNSPCLSESPESPWETFIPQRYFHESSVSSICPSLYDTPEPRKRFIAEISSGSSSHSTSPFYDSSSASDGSSHSTYSSLYDSPEPPQKKVIVELSSDNSSGLASPPLFQPPVPHRKGSVIVISSESSEGIPEPHPLCMFQDDGFSRWPVPEDNGLYSAESRQCVESEVRAATPTSLPVQATSTEQIHHEMADRPKYTLHTLWKNILDSNFPESVNIYQITDHYIRTEGYIVGDGNCMFRAISFALYGDQRKHGDVRKLVVNYMAENIDERVGQEKVKLLCDLNWRDYLEEMQKEGTWGDEYVLINAALACRTNIAVLSTGGTRKYIKTFTFSGEQVIAICHDGSHYEVLKGIR
ncbi:OTU-domain-containing protein [Wallemia mellicola]|uniref:OTU-domain-containing protein n=1 Tax=Wallemia mellicola TaxID=1708541 RepID=A0A4T0TS45_9BASI|nr:OTU-domain-containing protein [Wallemia mellicola]